MFFIMIVAIIGTAAGLGRMLEGYSQARLESAFLAVALAALLVGLLALIRLEPRTSSGVPGERHRLREVYAELRASRQVRLFFIYLVLMLAAVLGQDVLLEPYAARAFAMPVEQTTRITSLWGAFYLLSLLAAGLLEGRVPKRRIAVAASWLAMLAFGLVALSALAGGQALFYTGVVLLGLATGPATVSNLSIMLDMTVPGKVGLFIGAWGSASAFARLLGSLLTAGLRDLARLSPSSALYGYTAGFLLLALFLGLSLLVLGRVDRTAFRQAEEPGPSAFEAAALAAGQD